MQRVDCPAAEEQDAGPPPSPQHPLVFSLPRASPQGLVLLQQPDLRRRVSTLTSLPEYLRLGPTGRSGSCRERQTGRSRGPVKSVASSQRQWVPCVDLGLSGYDQELKG